ncbi:hypothetical protein [Reinekea sp.]|uniref:hypothetical protein n=1 Tax=Reinekea sp. TaxID=1970455 RepID=UPI002A825113|nr:hypothetical protein [Reinekea sp.]
MTVNDGELTRAYGSALERSWGGSALHSAGQLWTTGQYQWLRALPDAMTPKAAWQVWLSDTQLAQVFAVSGPALSGCSAVTGHRCTF